MKHFKTLEDIVSDRDLQFIDTFWVKLFKIMGIESKSSIANHPQTYEQTEKVDALLKEYLRHYIMATQEIWLELMDTT